MARMFEPSDINMLWTEEELWRMVRRRGFTPDGQPTLWGNGFALWYMAGGREELAAARLELAEALTILEAAEIG